MARAEGLSGVCFVVMVADLSFGSDHCVTRRQTVSRHDSIVQNNVEYRLMNVDSAVVCNKAEFA